MAATMSRLWWLALLFVAFKAGAVDPADAAALAFTQHPGAAMPAGVLFRDTDGRTIDLREVAAGKPLVLLMGYFECPNLCPTTRASLYRALHAASLVAGQDYSLAAISIDPNENAAQASAAKSTDMTAFSPAGAPQALHYLTGDGAAIGAITSAVGFKDRRDATDSQFIHPAGIVVVTPKGVISSYLLGVGYRPSEVRQALERSRLTPMMPTYATPILLLCFHYDPTTGRYSLAVLKLIRLGALLSIAILAGVLFLLFRREGKPA
jgi:protein SCO1/2